jgi:hypothetical protein
MSRFVVTATWDDAPHLTPEMREELWSSIPPFQRDARTKGIPQLGSGAVYQVPESSITIPDFELPKHWPRAYALDAAASGPTAAVWGAHDREAQIVYLYSVYRREQAEPAIHAAAIKARGEWIQGVGDVAGVVNSDGDQFITIYQRLGLKIELADKGVESGIQEVWELLSAGRLKIFASCGAWFEEFRLYRRDEKGRIVKANDHLMDATRYLIKSGMQRARTNAPKPAERIQFQTGPTGWMG